MIRGIGGKPYINLDPYIDVHGFKTLHPEIAKGFACARDYAKEGTWMEPGFDWKDSSYIMNWKPIYKAVEEYIALPLDHPIRVVGDPLYFTDLKDFRNRNIFTRYLKTTMGANDPYIYYFLWDQGDWNERNAERQKTDESKYFPGVVKWVENLQHTGIIDRIGRVIFFHCDHNGRAFEHRDLDARNGIMDDKQYSAHNNEFIHIRYRTKRGFYIWDPETENKTYLNCNAAFWNDQDWHGGEESKEVEYGMRIDCKFTPEFRKTIGIDHLEVY
tara:strand:- start:21169 stop:21984 length:816 start_codon:yes stop_codon:yes gene_type:complete